MYENPAVFSLKDVPPARRAGQFVMPRVDFADPGSVARAEGLVRDFGVCGFIVFRGEMEEVRRTVARLNALSDFPLLFGCDVERGLGQQVRGATYFPFAMSQGAADDPDLVRRQAAATAEEMKYCGLNLAFAPVLDINSEPRNPIINVRAFSDDPAAVSRLGGIFAETLQKEGVMACGKHFPGHGSTTRDSHVELPVVGGSLRSLMERDVAPFREAVAGRLCCVMPAHVSYPALDPDGLPATLSSRVLKDLLREKLGFDGLVVSDSFMMDALGGAESEEENMLAAISRGVDVVLDPRDPSGFLERNGRSGFFSDPARAESLARIFRARGLFASGGADAPAPGLGRNRKLAEEISRRSACLLRGGPLRGERTFLCCFGTAENSELLHELASALERGGKRVEKRFAFPETPVLPDDGSLLCVVSTGVSAWTENCLVPDEAVSWVDGFSRFSGEKALLCFGSPYPAGRFGFFDAAVVFFDSMPCAGRAAAEVLLGKKKAAAKLPVDVGP